MRVAGIFGGLLTACGLFAANVATASSAAAADLPAAPPMAPVAVPAPVVAPPNWAGFYLGVEGGGVIGNSNQIANGPLGFGPLTSGYNVSGGLVGGTVGYNWQFGNWVAGLEGDMSWTDITGEAHDSPPFTAGSADKTKEDWLATFRGRFGWTTSNNILFYVTGGGAAASVEAVIVPPAASVRTDTEVRWGGTGGAGIEAKLGPNWSAKVEYLYVKFASQGYFANPPPGTNARSDVPLDNNVFRVGINYALP